MTIVEEGLALVDAAGREGVTLRLLGGAAIFLHCPKAVADGPYRQLADLDAITRASDAPRVARVLEARHYEPDARFNALHGDRRLIFSGPHGKLDVFVEAFEMCHRIQLGERLRLEKPTLPVSDLLLTKLQIVQLNAKDVQDVVAILSEHELGSGPGDHIDVDYLSGLMSGDWGLWRTTSGTLRRISEMDSRVAGAARGLLDAFDRVPKTMGFKLRARIGERVRWYELPDEVE